MCKRATLKVLQYRKSTAYKSFSFSQNKHRYIQYIYFLKQDFKKFPHSFRLISSSSRRIKLRYRATATFVNFVPQRLSLNMLNKKSHMEHVQGCMVDGPTNWILFAFKKSFVFEEDCAKASSW